MIDATFPPDWLPDLIDVNGIPSYVFERLHLQFRLDFFDAPCSFRGVPVLCNSFVKPEEIYEEKFWHLVSRDDYATAGRLLDTRRAEKLTWCAAVIANADDSAVLAWNYLEGSGRIRTYLWLRDWDYVVILEAGRRKDVYWLITAFHVDERKRRDLEGRYRRREEDQ